MMEKSGGLAAGCNPVMVGSTPTSILKGERYGIFYKRSTLLP